MECDPLKGENFAKSLALPSTASAKGTAKGHGHSHNANTFECLGVRAARHTDF